MLIKFFPNGKGAGAGPVGYLVTREVLAYDSNRDLIRDADGQPMTVIRDPLPEVLRGDSTRTEALIDASRNQWTYRAGVISFASEDAPTEAQQVEVMNAFEPPQLNWSTVMFRKRRTTNGKQETEARRDCLEVTAG